MQNILNSGSGAAPVLQSADALPHEKGGIDIEGLAATRAGALFVGFRSPLVDSKALVVPIMNVQDVVQRGVCPQLGDDVLLDLNGMGILDIAPTQEPDEFIIIAGAPGSQNGSTIFKWRMGEAPVNAYALPPGGGSPDAILMDVDGVIMSRPTAETKELPRARSCPKSSGASDSRSSRRSAETPSGTERCIRALASPAGCPVAAVAT